MNYLSNKYHAKDTYPFQIAQKTGHHETIGIDLVAMCANDILAEGGEPLFFLDYLACGQLNVDVSHCIIHGITEGCLVAGCALTGKKMLPRVRCWYTNQFQVTCSQLKDVF